MNFKTVGFAAVVFATLLVQADAHHSFTMFDHEKLITISGTLKEFEWSNPHCWLHIVVADTATGRNLEWAFEMGSITQIAEQGWKADSVKPGDKITVIGHPLKDGSRGAQYRHVSLGDGRSFKHPTYVPNNDQPTR